jgi:hypothetical protein
MMFVWYIWLGMLIGYSFANWVGIDKKKLWWHGYETGKYDGEHL